MYFHTCIFKFFWSQLLTRGGYYDFSAFTLFMSYAWYSVPYCFIAVTLHSITVSLTVSSVSVSSPLCSCRARRLYWINVVWLWLFWTFCKTICTSIYLSVVSILAAESVRLLGPSTGRLVWLRHDQVWCVRIYKNPFHKLQSPLVVFWTKAFRPHSHPLLTHFTHCHHRISEVHTLTVFRVWVKNR